ncbi:MAG: GNAT family N-acetyltransferase [Alphaproteobacteria bacterium]|nr:GNAT family N-acetyltransferase [Alphaproteobacteria bacterium]
MMRNKNLTRPITLYLIGFAGSGKYTIAKEIAKSGYKVVDNHLINNPIFSLLDLNDETPIAENAWISVRKIRHIILDFIAQDQKSNFIFTNALLEKEGDWKVYNLIKETAEKRGSLFVPLKLILSAEEHKKRITNPDRKTRLKTTNPAEVHIKKEMIKIDHPHLMEVDVTDLSARDAAEKILSFVKSLENSFSANEDKYSVGEIVLDEMDTSEIRELLWQGIKAFNQPYTGDITTQPFSLSIRDENSKIIAGVYGFTFYDHARVEYTWVEESYRKQGLGRKLFQKLEEYCRSKGCSVIQLDTLDFQSPIFYEKMGYEYIGTVSEWINGHDCYFMRKML